jgi:ferredoxin-NADP reductase
MTAPTVTVRSARSWIERHAIAVSPRLGSLIPDEGGTISGEIESIDPLTSSAASITIKVGRGWTPHQPGQYTTLQIEVDGVRHHRCYSITSVPDRRRVQLSVQAIDGGVVSAHLVAAARPGDSVRLAPAAGDFVMPDQASGPHLFISGGSGITPVMGMVRSITAPPVDQPIADVEPADVALVHFAADRSRLLFADELSRLAEADNGVNVSVHYTRDTPDSTSRRLSADLLDRECLDWATRPAFVCGPPSMVAAALELWAERGCSDLLHVERFVPAGRSSWAPDGQGAETGDQVVATRHAVTFTTSDLTVPTDGHATLLAIAEDAGLSPASGCRMGICHTCVRPLASGRGQDQRDGRVIEAGEHVQLCVTAPLTDLEVEL